MTVGKYELFVMLMLMLTVDYYKLFDADAVLLLMTVDYYKLFVMLLALPYPC